MYLLPLISRFSSLVTSAIAERHSNNIAEQRLRPDKVGWWARCRGAQQLFRRQTAATATDTHVYKEESKYTGCTMPMSAVTDIQVSHQPDLGL